MIIHDNDTDADATEVLVAGDVAGTAYRETLTSVDGFTRGPNGRIKFNKDTKKRRREEDAMDVDVDPQEKSLGKHKKTKKDESKFGHEFKAKVSNGLDKWTGKLTAYLFHLCRRLRVMSRKAQYSPTPTCRLLKLQRQDIEIIAPGLWARNR
jgi:hypothetical protein